ncbi:MAG: hypothetical protein RR603_06805, partial [Kurthia sp.]
MKKLLSSLALGILATTTLVACTSADDKKGSHNSIATEEKNYLSKIDSTYAFDFAKSLEQFKTNDQLGYRTAGSQAELQTG